MTDSQIIEQAVGRDYSGSIVFESPHRLREIAARVGGLEGLTLREWATLRESEDYEHERSPGVRLNQTLAQVADLCYERK